MRRTGLVTIALCLAAGCATGQVGTVPAPVDTGPFPGAPPGPVAPFPSRVEGVLARLRAADQALATADLREADEQVSAATDALWKAEAALPRSAGMHFAGLRELLAEAREQIAQGDPSEARFLVSDVTAGVERARIAAPLAAVRSNLLAGAAALEQEQWELAQELVAEAIVLVTSIQAPEGTLLAAELEDLELQARLFLARFNAGGRPHPERLERLAAQAVEIPIG